MNQPQKITFAELRAQGFHSPLVYRSDFRCSHLVAISASRKYDGYRLRVERAGNPVPSGAVTTGADASRGLRNPR
jgi:hypothetical protein